MTTPREQAVAELRRAIDVLPESTRKAMLIGLGNNTVIAGAFDGGDGVCPMMAAHREGGVTRCASFPEAWDRFTGVYGRSIIRKATQYEVDILRGLIQESLQPKAASDLAAAIAEHKASVEVSRREAEQASRKRRLRITGGELFDLGGVIEEHRESARQRRSREAEQVGLDWLFEETLVLPEDFGVEPAADVVEEFDFDAAEAELLRQ